MVKGIILSDNFNIVKNILNNVDIEISYKIMSCENDFESYIKKNNVDIIFIDKKLNINLTDKAFENYQSIILLISDEEDFKSSELNSKVFEITRNVKNTKKDKIMTELQDLGYSTRHQGTYYLADIIEEVSNSTNYVDNNLQNILYPRIAKKYGKSAYNIKSSVHKATECMYYECDVNKLQEYFRFYEDTKPTVKEVIYAVSNNI